MEIGTIVIQNNLYPKERGKVVANQLSTPGYVAVEWANGNLEKMSVSLLEVVNSKLEVTYNEIKEKITKASSLLKEANFLARSNNSILSELHYELGFNDLFSELREGGWCTSSMEC